MNTIFDDSSEIEIQHDLSKKSEKELLITIAVLLDQHVRRGPHHETPCQFSQSIEKKVWAILVLMVASAATMIGTLIGK